MSEPEGLSPIAQALLAGDDKPGRMVPCCVCKEPAYCPGFVIESVKLWNRKEAEAGDAEQRRANLIGYSDLGVTCSRACAVTERERRRADLIAENATTSGYLTLLRAGSYNPESLAWLRSHGHSKDVTRMLASAGTEKTK